MSSWPEDILNTQVPKRLVTVTGSAYVDPEARKKARARQQLHFDKVQGVMSPGWLYLEAGLTPPTESESFAQKLRDWGSLRSRKRQP